VSAQWLDVVYGVVLIVAVILSAQLRPRRRAEVPA
jgi:ribose/xylose/arabinose/galactoside ABC-type transport system permease subunit